MRSTPSVVAAAALAFAAVSYALDPAPVSLQASDWLGIDGNWSTVSFLLGSDSELVNVLISTTLSEFWAIGSGGCAPNDPRCSNARGGLYSPKKSKHWNPIGLWQLGLTYFGYNDNGEYGLDAVNAYSPITNIAFGMSNVLMAAINTTSPYLGLFGVGIQQGRFGDLVADSPITQAVKTFGWIPSYSYGYTAGAHYRNTVVSATLGGYDTARFVQHDTAFTLTPGESIPRTLVRNIQITAKDRVDRPGSWSSSTDIMSNWSTSFTAMIDSSTPYLWLPEPICNRFARSLNLTYNTTFDLYTLPDSLYRKYSADNSLALTFSLTSFDNHDNFDSPLEVPGLVNISVPLRAFVSYLEYPFGHGAIAYGDPAVPYFTLRKSENDSFILGRTFLQESYLITKFDESVYSIHQALFPENPVSDANLVPIRQPKNSPYPPPPTPKSNDELTPAQMIGIAVGAVLLCVVILAAWYYCRRRSRSHQGKSKKTEDDDHNDSASTLAPDSPKTPVSRILSKMGCRKQSLSRRAAAATKTTTTTTTTTTDSGRLTHPVGVIPVEAPDCQVFELAASVTPVELDAGSDGNSIEETELGTHDTQQISPYELAKLKIERQLRGPVPEYTPPADGIVVSSDAKTAPEVPPATQPARAVDEHPSPASPTRSATGGWIPGQHPSTSEPSPVSPRTEGDLRLMTLPPSPVTLHVQHSIAAPFDVAGAHADQPDYLSSRTSRSHPENSTTTTHTFARDSATHPSTRDSSTAHHRVTIDPNKVVCLGPLPENLHIERHNMLTRLVDADGHGVSLALFNAASVPSEGSLGSNYTEEEDRMVEELTRQASVSQARSSFSHPRASFSREGDERPPLPRHAEELSSSSSSSTSSPPPSREPRDGPEHQTGHPDGRIDPGRDLVHVPQLADKRYSWEDQ
ncbi:putative aspartyl protease [Ophiocordyceps camponoti-leonardi (nom. inval.)]|nr:putative aspartyl protease [Ophiocordyceps camponoti-leonardi (nom. inval.)]